MQVEKERFISHYGSHKDDFNVKIKKKSVASGEFSQNTEQTVKDSIALIKRYGLERHREYILAKLKELKPITEDDRKEIKFLLEEKMNIDNQLK